VDPWLIHFFLPEAAIFRTVNEYGLREKSFLAFKLEYGFGLTASYGEALLRTMSWGVMGVSLMIVTRLTKSRSDPDYSMFPKPKGSSSSLSGLGPSKL
jgi:hypothetical protein